MIGNYLKICVRNLIRFRFYSFINIMGLGVGLVCFILISMFIIDEISTDRFHDNADRLVRVITDYNRGGVERQLALSAPALAPEAHRSIPQVQGVARLCYGPESLFWHGSQSFSESYCYAESSLFTLFSFRLIRGSAGNVLDEPYEVVLSDELAAKVFGDSDPLGETLTFNGMNLKVGGIFQRIPSQSHIQSDIFISIPTMEDKNAWGKGALAAWNSYNFYTYLLLDKEENSELVKEKLNQLLKIKMNPEDAKYVHISLEPFTDIYLRSKAAYGSRISGNIYYIYVFLAISVFILILAAINFMNLATARSVTRSREVGIRKVCGSTRIHLVIQFLGEALIQAGLALILALVMAEFLLPFFNQISGKSLQLNLLGDVWFLLLILAVTLTIGFLAGLYPSFVLSSFKPAHILRSGSRRGSDGSRLRKVLVVVQFAISITLIIGTVTIYRQLNFMKSKDLGFDQENLLYIPLRSNENKQDVSVLKQKIESLPTVISASVSSRMLGQVYSGWHIMMPGMKEKYGITALFTDEDFLATFGMQISQGRGFSKKMTTDKEQAFLLNEEAVRDLGTVARIGAPIEMSGVKQGILIGIVKDFNFQPLKNRTKPLLITFSPGYFHNLYLAVRIQARQIENFLKQAATTWEEFAPGQSFEFHFQDEMLGNLYKSEKRIGKIASSFSMLAVFIGCLGLLGLSAFTAEQKSKEVGIRKVLGATSSSIVVMIAREFGRLVILANIIAWPLAYLVMSDWLEDFGYRTDLSVWTFFIAAIIALFLALVTVSYQSLKLSNTDPVDTLKYE